MAALAKASGLQEELARTSQLLMDGARARWVYVDVKVDSMLTKMRDLLQGGVLHVSNPVALMTQHGED